MKNVRIIFFLPFLFFFSEVLAQIEKPKPTPKPAPSTKPVNNSTTPAPKPIVISTEGWTPFVFQQKWGFKDKTGTVVIQPALDYDYCYAFFNGLARAYVNGYVFYINETGAKISSKKFDAALDFSGNLAPVQDVDQKKWHYINKAGEIAIYEEYDMAYEFIDGLAIVVNNKKYSFINLKGENIFNRDFDYASQFQNNLAIVQEGEDHTLKYIDKTGKNIFGDKVFASAFPFIGNWAQVSDVGNSRAYYFIDRTGKRKELSFSIRSDMNRETNEEIMKYGNYYIGWDSVAKNFSFLDQSFSPTGVRYKSIWALGKKGNSSCQLESGKWIVLDKDLRQIGGEYQWIGLGFDNALTVVQISDSLFKFVDEKGSFAKDISSITWPQYGNGFYLIEPAKQSRWFMNVLGEKKYGPYKWAYSFGESPLAPIKNENDQCYFITRDGIMKGEIYSGIGAFVSGLGYVAKDGKCWFINYNGENIFNKTFEEAGAFNDYGYAKVKQNGKWGCINTDGKAVVPIIYENCNPFRNHDLTEIQLNGKWGYINKKSVVVIPCTYDDEDWFGWNGRKYARVQYKGKWGCIDDTGRVLVDYTYSKKEDVPVPK